MSAESATPRPPSTSPETAPGPTVSGTGRVTGVAGVGALIRPGVLTAVLPAELVAAAVAATGRGERRRCKLPATAVVYFVICLCLFAGADTLAPPGYRPVMSSLMRGLRRTGRYRLPVSSAFTKARQRLGSAPMRWLFEQTRGTIANPGTPGAFALGLRLVSWDGALFDVADTPSHHQQFPAGTGVGDPQIRVLTLTECATHAVIDAVFGGAGTNSEQALAATLSGALTPGMLLLADRLFPGYELWGKAHASGAQLLWRVKCKNVYHPVADLPDGSQLAVMATPRDAQRYGKARFEGRPISAPPQGQLIRVIDYTITVRSTDAGQRQETFRLITTLLDHQAYPAAQLAALYPQRWESETANSEIKCRLKGARFALRSRTPELVRQEVWALLVTYQALTRLAFDAATSARTAAARISFSVTLRTVRDSIPGHVTRTPVTLSRAYARAVIDIAGQQLATRRPRSQPRKVKPPQHKYEHLRRGERRSPGTVARTLQIVPKTGAGARSP